MLVKSSKIALVYANYSELCELFQRTLIDSRLCFSNFTQFIPRRRGSTLQDKGLNHCERQRFLISRSAFPSSLFFLCAVFKRYIHVRRTIPGLVLSVLCFLSRLEAFNECNTISSLRQRIRNQLNNFISSLSRGRSVRRRMKINEAWKKWRKSEQRTRKLRKWKNHNCN